MLLTVPTALLASAAVGATPGTPTGLRVAGLRVAGAQAPAHLARARVPAVPDAPAPHRRLVLERPVPDQPARAASRAPLDQWVLPCSCTLSSPFGERWGRLHSGIDLAAPYGTPIRAATDGVIVFAGAAEGYGRLLLIQDSDGTVTAYGHMSSFVRTSGPVHAGDVIARIGAAGDATGPHLHFEVRIGGEHGTPVDPVPVLARHGVRV